MRPKRTIITTILIVLTVMASAIFLVSSNSQENKIRVDYEGEDFITVGNESVLEVHTKDKALCFSQLIISETAHRGGGGGSSHQKEMSTQNGYVHTQELNGCDKDNVNCTIKISCEGV